MKKYYFHYLRKSPMFHFSLHAKELFHSNFLAWLGTDDELKPVFKMVMLELGIDENFVDSWGTDFEVLREKYNLDLIVKAPDKWQETECNDAKKQVVPGQWYVVIENKFKSIPTKNQLDRYTKEIESKSGTNLANVEKLLLVPSDHFVQSGHRVTLGNDWRVVDYTQVVSALIKSAVFVNDLYKKAIIFDYIGVVDALVNIVQSQNVSIYDKFLCVPSKELDDLHIADLVDKWRAACIADMLTEKTGKEWTVGYTNKQPIIETFYRFDDIIVGIQIQGCQYRRYIIGDIKESDIPTVSKGFLSDTRKEFRDKMLKLYPNVFVDKAVKGEANKNYCSYDKDTEGDTFWYQYVVIDQNATIEQIMECVASDMKIIKGLFNSIKKNLAIMGFCKKLSSAFNRSMPISELSKFTP